jgi:hypothetical protein
MSASFGCWQLGVSLGATVLGGRMPGMNIGIFIVLAAATFGSALLYAISVSASQSSQRRSFCCFSTRHG